MRNDASVRRAARAFAVAALGTALAACHSSPSAEPPPPHGPALPVGPISHADRWLTDAEGRVMLFHGVNVVNKDPPYTPSAQGFSGAHAAWLADNGFRVVRVGVLATGLMPSPGMIDPTYVASIAATVADLASHDVYSLIDFHQDGWGPTTGSDGFPDWATLTGTAMNNTSAMFPLYYEQNPALQQAFQSFWDDLPGPGGTGLEEQYAAMFGALATALADQPYVLGYDLFNEPWPGTTWSDCLNAADGCPSLDTGELGPAYAKATAAIRAAGDQHLVFGEPFVTFNFGYSTTSVPVPGGDPEAGMAFHVYPILNSEIPDVVKNAVSWAKSTNGALLNTEFGAVTDPDTLSANVTALDSALVPWIFWSFCCELVPSFMGAPGGQNLVSSTAGVLVEAHPLAVAGTPETLSVDATSRKLSFTYSTTGPGGVAYVPGTVTSLEVPALTYPDGYTATVTNGWITSAPCASILTIEAKAGAESVDVEITPGGKCP
jgi:endoglycosylceramidase